MKNVTNENKKDSRTGLEIAVIGMAVRFPGAKNVQEFWDNLKNGVESISFISDSEVAGTGFDPELFKNTNYVKSIGGAFENKEYFDARFFGYTPGEAKLMDPQMRIFHECAWEALEDAGCIPSKYGGLIGLYAGGESSLDWEGRVLLSGLAYELGVWAATHLSYKDYLVTRVSHRLDLKGPAVIIQTACSTSLAAVHIACRALLTGDCHIALAGGISVTSSPRVGYLYQEDMIFSPDGHCRAFDAKAKGTVSSEGAGIVVLKPLQAAISDGDHIYAIIKGSAMNNDGITKIGFTAPSPQGQAAVIKAAQRFARVESESIGYIETHGTGTALGDPIEIEALSKAFNTKKRKFCAVGSVKTNVGHLGITAGIAGFIKTVLVLKNKLVPASLHFETPNPAIDFENSPFLVNTKLTPWKNDKYPLRAGVSSFGIGGTNAHVILEEAPAENRDKEGTRGRAPLFNEESSKKYRLILLSAKTSASLDRMAENLVNHFKKNPDLNLADAVYTLQVGREAYRYRKIVLCTSLDEAAAALATGDPARVETFQVIYNEPSVVFMFPGQGSQYVNMGLELYRSEPVFREEMDRCIEILKPIMGCDIKEILYPHFDCKDGFPGPPPDGVGSLGQGDPRESPLPSDQINQTGITQPVIFALEYSLARLLLNWGIKPQAMIGHSLGEYTAACLAGVFSLEEALALVALRGKLMQKMAAGSMLSVPLPEAELKPLLDEELAIAAVNSSALCVVSGTDEAIAKFAKKLKNDGYECRKLLTSYAFHSRMMDPMLAEFEAKVKEFHFQEPGIPYISNLTGDWISAEDVTDSRYWVRHLRETVRFSKGLEKLLSLEKAIFVEVGPGNALSKFVNLHSQKTNDHIIMNLVRHPHENVPDVYYLLKKIGRLWIHGQPIDWNSFYANEKRHRISLPTYPFDRQYYWIEKVDYRNIDNNTNTNAGQIIVSTPDLSPGDNPSSNYFTSFSKAEKEILKIWQDLLGYERIGVDDNFFELGGDSVTAAAVRKRVKDVFNIDIPLVKIFHHPTIRSFAKSLLKGDEPKDKNSNSFQPGEDLVEILEKF
jgi:phthiocerol/phenolphthiocerol synthesis type-I polyketide synthase E